MTRTRSHSESSRQPLTAASGSDVRTPNSFQGITSLSLPSAADSVSIILSILMSHSVLLWSTLQLSFSLLFSTLTLTSCRFGSADAQTLLLASHWNSPRKKSATDARRNRDLKWTLLVCNTYTWHLDCFAFSAIIIWFRADAENILSYNVTPQH